MPLVVRRNAIPCLYFLRSGSFLCEKRLKSWLSRKIRILSRSGYKKSCARDSYILNSPFDFASEGSFLSVKAILTNKCQVEIHRGFQIRIGILEFSIALPPGCKSGSVRIPGFTYNIKIRIFVHDLPAPS